MEKMLQPLLLQNMSCHWKIMHGLAVSVEFNLDDVTEKRLVPRVEK